MIKKNPSNFQGLLRAAYTQIRKSRFISSSYTITANQTKYFGNAKNEGRIKQTLKFPYIKLNYMINTELRSSPVITARFIKTQRWVYTVLFVSLLSADRLIKYDRTSD